MENYGNRLLIIFDKHPVPPQDHEVHLLCCKYYHSSLIYICNLAFCKIIVKNKFFVLMKILIRQSNISSIIQLTIQIIIN